MSTSVYKSNSIFWVEIHKIRPNPFQPRKDFNEQALAELAESIRQYGILQPLVVTRKEEQRPDGGLSVYYELIAGERRLRAAKIAGLEQVPVIIRNDTDDTLRLELAIIENLQREDLNPIDRALAFEQLHKQFNFTHTEIGRRMGRSRVYVSNTLRILSLPEEIKLGLISGKINEGHTRPLLMLSDRPEEQKKLYEEIIARKLSVRDAEKIARRIAQDKVRKKKFIIDPRIREYEKRLSENLGTRVHIEQKEKGGKILIDYFSVEDLEKILHSLKGSSDEVAVASETFSPREEEERYKYSYPNEVYSNEDTTITDFAKRNDIELIQEEESVVSSEIFSSPDKDEVDFLREKEEVRKDLSFANFHQTSFDDISISSPQEEGDGGSLLEEKNKQFSSQEETQYDDPLEMWREWDSPREEDNVTGRDYRESIHRFEENTHLNEESPRQEEDTYNHRYNKREENNRYYQNTQIDSRDSYRKYFSQEDEEEKDGGFWGIFS